LTSSSPFEFYAQMSFVLSDRETVRVVLLIVVDNDSVSEIVDIGELQEVRVYQLGH